MAVATYHVDGVDASRWTLVRGSTYRATVTARRSTVEVPGRHGVIDARALAPLEAPTVTLELRPAVDQRVDVDALEGDVDDLVAAFSTPGLMLEREVGSRRVSAAAVLESITPDEEWVAGHFAKVTVGLRLPGVFWRGDVVETSGQADFGTGFVTDAVVRMQGVDPELHDEVTGTGIAWRGTVPSGSYVFIDAGSLQAWTSTSPDAWSMSGVDVSSGVDYPARGPLQIKSRVVSTDDPPLFPSEGLYPSEGLFPSEGSAFGSLTRSSSLHASGPYTIRARTAWL